MGCTSDKASRRASEFCGYIVISAVVDDRGIREVVLGDLDGVSGCMDKDVLISFTVFVPRSFATDVYSDEGRD